MVFKLSTLSRKDLLFNGVYRITCLKNGKFYIGSCAARDYLYTRLLHHWKDLQLGRHHNRYLQRAFLKYGEDSFVVDILEECKPEDCILKEQYWIDFLRPHYNFCKKAGSTLGRECTLETRKKISEANKEWHSNHPEFIEKIRNRKKREKKPRVINEDKWGKLKKKVYDLKTGECYSSTVEASKMLSIPTSYISLICTGKYLSDKYKLTYEEQ